MSNLDSNTIQQLGDELFDALNACKTIDPFTSRYDNITLEDAYSIQQRMIQRRLDAGAKVVGKKIGVTSAAVMNMLGVYQPDFGYLLDTMIAPSSEPITVAGKLIQPRAEGEIAFVMKKDLMGPGVSNADVLAATECVMPCFEIVDSRIHDWKIKIQDTVADNASCGVFIMGDAAVKPYDMDFYSCGMVVEKNGELVGTGAGAAALGSPVNAITWLANTLGRLGMGLKAGDVVLSGALSALVPVQAGDSLRMQIGGLGSCQARFV